MCLYIAGLVTDDSYKLIRLLLQSMIASRVAERHAVNKYAPMTDKMPPNDARDRLRQAANNNCHNHRSAVT